MANHTAASFLWPFLFFCLFLCFGGSDFIYLFMKLCADVGHLYHCMIHLYDMCPSSPPS